MLAKSKFKQEGGHSQSISTLMHDVFNKLAPCNISNLFYFSRETHNYNTRFSSTGNYHIKYSRLNQQSKSFSRLGAKVWNSIPLELRKLPKHSFKRKMQDLLFHILIKEDDYVGIPTLISEFSELKVTT